MATLTLNDEELQLVLDSLSESYGSLREQVYKAEEPRFKDQIKRREQLMKGLLEKARAVGPLPGRRGPESPTKDASRIA